MMYAKYGLDRNNVDSWEDMLRAFYRLNDRNGQNRLAEQISELMVMRDVGDVVFNHSELTEMIDFLCTS